MSSDEPMETADSDKGKVATEMGTVETVTVECLFPDGTAEVVPGICGDSMSLGELKKRVAEERAKRTGEEGKTLHMPDLDADELDAKDASFPVRLQGGEETGEVSLDIGVRGSGLDLYRAAAVALEKDEREIQFLVCGNSMIPFSNVELWKPTAKVIGGFTHFTGPGCISVACKEGDVPSPVLAFGPSLLDVRRLQTWPLNVATQMPNGQRLGSVTVEVDASKQESLSDRCTVGWLKTQILTQLGAPPSVRLSLHFPQHSTVSSSSLTDTEIGEERSNDSEVLLPFIQKGLCRLTAVIRETAESSNEEGEKGEEQKENEDEKMGVEGGEEGGSSSSASSSSSQPKPPRIPCVYSLKIQLPVSSSASADEEGGKERDAFVTVCPWMKFSTFCEAVALKWPEIFPSGTASVSTRVGWRQLSGDGTKGSHSSLSTLKLVPGVMSVTALHDEALKTTGNCGRGDAVVLQRSEGGAHMRRVEGQVKLHKQLEKERSVLCLASLTHTLNSTAMTDKVSLKEWGLFKKLNAGAVSDAPVSPCITLYGVFTRTLSPLSPAESGSARMSAGASQLFAFSSAWQPSACEQSKSGMAAFLACLRVVSSEDRGLLRVTTGVFRELVGDFPPAVLAFHKLLVEQSPLLDSEKSALSAALYEAMAAQSAFWMASEAEREEEDEEDWGGAEVQAAAAAAGVNEQRKEKAECSPLVFERSSRFFFAYLLTEASKVWKENTKEKKENEEEEEEEGTDDEGEKAETSLNELGSSCAFRSSDLTCSMTFEPLVDPVRLPSTSADGARPKVYSRSAAVAAIQRSTEGCQLPSDSAFVGVREGDLEADECRQLLVLAHPLATRALYWPQETADKWSAVQKSSKDKRDLRVPYGALKSRLQETDALTLVPALGLRTRLKLPCLTFDESGLLGVYVGRGKGADASIEIWSPLEGETKMVNEQQLAQKIARLVKEGKVGEVGREATAGCGFVVQEEAVMICLDVSGSMDDKKPFPPEKKNGGDSDCSSSNESDRSSEWSAFSDSDEEADDLLDDLLDSDSDEEDEDEDEVEWEEEDEDEEMGTGGDALGALADELRREREEARREREDAREAARKEREERRKEKEEQRKERERVKREEKEKKRAENPPAPLDPATAAALEQLRKHPALRDLQQICRANPGMFSKVMKELCVISAKSEDDPKAAPLYAAVRSSKEAIRELLFEAPLAPETTALQEEGETGEDEGTGGDPTDEDSVRPEFLCPITRTVMQEPVVTEDGHTYEKTAIDKWFEMRAGGKRTSPMTGLPLKRSNLVPNFALASAINKWKGDRRTSSSSSSSSASSSASAASSSSSGKALVSVKARFVASGESVASRSFASSSRGMPGPSSSNSDIPSELSFRLPGSVTLKMLKKKIFRETGGRYPPGFIFFQGRRVTDSNSLDQLKRQKEKTTMKAKGGAAEGEEAETEIGLLVSRKATAVVRVKVFTEYLGLRRGPLVFAMSGDRRIEDVALRVWNLLGGGAGRPSRTRWFTTMEDRGDNRSVGQVVSFRERSNLTTLARQWDFQSRLCDEDERDRPGTVLLGGGELVTLRLWPAPRPSRAAKLRQQRNLSRLQVVKQLFHAFVNRSEAYALPHSLGLVLFGSEAEVTCPLTPLFEDFKEHVNSADAEGDTAMIDAIDIAAEELLEFRKQNSTARLRVLCLTDGKDNKSTKQAHNLAERLRNQHIVVDAMCIGARERDFLLLKGITNFTGGYCFHPGTLREALGVAELETYLSTKDRKDRSGFARSLAARVLGSRLYCAANLEVLGANCEFDSADTAERREEPRLKAPVASLEIALRKMEEEARRRGREGEKKEGEEKEEDKEAKKEGTGRRPSLTSTSSPAPPKLSKAAMRRLALEMKRLQREPHPNIRILPSSEDLTFWKLLVTGPEGTPYGGGNWLCYVSFPPDFPARAPEVRFVTPILHCNVNRHGRICHAVLDRDWVASTSIRTVLDCVFGLLLTPDASDPLDSDLALKFYDDSGEYEATVTQHVALHASKSLESWEAELTPSGSSAQAAAAAGTEDEVMGVGEEGGEEQTQVRRGEKRKVREKIN
uniref:UBC core domain-containing protein n=1 Tax=Chromera velia CCMP2878 TaxID=1169474 RepID=A0A0G4HFP5_9ALVE|eukprot:Cvel_6690.t1-p1 / transcript=Cvel_6690.t1 / gene=Cvel_6690 / organism=Chromera_velia_CCMP2878 / gene_product=Probable bifunctional E2/E3 enzyme R795, putative / transcript_product=Probable bifunctional E2/E3 enzyme R795, putative / location=Cvel_scaffold333:33554-47157(-) / protein_length=2062 / sequence_SO=supercontig / SO=protein_coding / is_pseudo=false